MIPNKNRRKIYLIRPLFQIRFIVITVLLVVLSCLLSALAMNRLLTAELSSQYRIAHLQIEDLVSRIHWAIILGHATAVVVAIVVCVFAILYLSHRIAGPLFRFQQVCNNIARGDFDFSTRLRPKDELNELAQAFQLMIDSLEAQKNKRAEIINQLKQAVQNLEQSSGDPKLKVNELRQLVLELDTEMGDKG